MVDLDNLTPLQEKVAHQFIDNLLLGKTVSFENFPDMDQAEFEELANAIVDYIKTGCH